MFKYNHNLKPQWCISSRRPVRETVTVTPASAGVQVREGLNHSLDSGLRRNDQYVFDTLPKQQARRLHADMTDSEQMLWSRLRRKQIGCVQFYRQKPIGNYIVDFYAPVAKLVMEIDGSQHMDPHQAQKDLERDAYLASQGLRVLRFNILQVLQELNSVVEVIFRELTDRLDGNPPNPPLQRGAKGGFFPPELAS